MVLQQTTILDRMKVVSRQLATALGTDAVAACGEVRLSEARLLMEKPESYWQMLALTENTGLQQSVTAVDMSRQQERIVKAASLPKVAVVASEGDAHVVHPPWYHRLGRALGVSCADVSHYVPEHSPKTSTDRYTPSLCI